MPPESWPPTEVAQVEHLALTGPTLAVEVICGVNQQMKGLCIYVWTCFFLFLPFK